MEAWRTRVERHGIVDLAVRHPWEKIISEWRKGASEGTAMPAGLSTARGRFDGGQDLDSIEFPTSAAKE